MEPRKTDILTSDEIIRKVAADLGLSDEKVRKVIEANIDYIIHLVENTDTINIRIPEIGQLYFNVLPYLKDFHRIKDGKVKGGRVKKDVEIHEKKHKKFEYYYKELVEAGRLKKPTKLKHTRRSFLTLKKYTAGKSIKEIEEIQNNYADNNEQD